MNELVLPERPRASPQMLLTGLAAERMRRDFSLFAQRAWHIVEPKKCVWNWHLDALCEHALWVTMGEIRNLMIQVPPRQTKSLITSVIWPVFHWIQRPETQFMCASYESSLTLEFAQGARRLIESAWFKQFYGTEWYLLPDENQKQLYRNNKGGYRISTSVNGKTTGFGADILCFPAGTLVSTALGDLPIESLRGRDIRVYSWNGRRVELKKATAFYRSIGKRFVTLTMSDGRQLKCTDDHRIYVVGRGWVEAQRISTGERLYARAESDVHAVPDSVLSRAITRMDELLVLRVDLELSEEEVYCIDVEGNHCFFADGILVHNCLDDPHNVKQAESDSIRQSAIEWHDNSWRSRANSPNTTQKIYIAQRTHDMDIMGHVLAMEGNRWVNLCLPMEFDPKRRCITYPNKGRGVLPDAKEIFRDPRQVEGELLNPKRFDAETAATEREAMSQRAWNAQYQQQPEGQGGLILKRGWWKQWVYPQWHAEAGKERPTPDFIEVIQVYDTAFEEDEEADFSACTTWGLFAFRESEKDPKTGRLREGKQRICALLLDWMEERMDFPTLRQYAIDANREWAPDWILIEKKASGHCYSDDTEVLTKRGWLTFTSIDVNTDQFATRNPRTKEFEWQYATAEIHERYNGSMVRFKSRTLDALVTPNHRMLVDSLPRSLGGNHTREGEVMVEAHKLIGMTAGKTAIPVRSIWRGTEISEQAFPICDIERARRFTTRPNLRWLDAEQEKRRKDNCASATEKTIRMSGDDYCAFMGAFLSEGWSRIAKNNKGAAVFISQRKKGTPAFHAFRELFSRILGKPVRHDGSDFVITRLGLAEHVRKFGDRAWTKFIPQIILDAPPRQLKIFWDYYMLGDDSIAAGGQIITTTSKILAGQLVEIAQKMGFAASMRQKQNLTKERIICNNKRPTKPENCKPFYSVSLHTSASRQFKTEAVPYDGFVHCVQVPNGTLYVRRSGYPLWCGNSLVQELRLKKLPVKAVKLTDGGDLTARVHAASLMLEKGCIYYCPRKWSLRMIELLAKFGPGDHGDTAASVAIAWQYMRKFHGLTLPDDEDAREISPFKTAKRKYG